jgi:hypothetical protein
MALSRTSHLYKIDRDKLKEHYASYPNDPENISTHLGEVSTQVSVPCQYSSAGRASSS